MKAWGRIGGRTLSLHPGVGYYPERIRNQPHPSQLPKTLDKLITRIKMPLSDDINNTK